MPEASAVKRINRELTGEPIQAGAYTLRPVAHLHARFEAPERESSDTAWGYARLKPVAHQMALTRAAHCHHHPG
jgi:hypothetical protein